MKYRQQGDVVLIKIKSIPKKATKIDKYKGVVQEGEHTGHAHRFQPGTTELMEMGESRYLRVLGPSNLTHEEHDTQEVEQGDYEVRIVRQKDPFTKLVSKVVD